LVIRDAHEGDPDALHILAVLDGCLERLSGNNRAYGYRMLRP
jgi:hypothetical protein